MVVLITKSVQYYVPTAMLSFSEEVRSEYLVLIGQCSEQCRAEMSPGGRAKEMKETTDMMKNMIGRDRLALTPMLMASASLGPLLVHEKTPLNRGQVRRGEKFISTLPRQWHQVHMSPANFRVSAQDRRERYVRPAVPASSRSARLLHDILHTITYCGVRRA